MRRERKLRVCVVSTDLGERMFNKTFCQRKKFFVEKNQPTMPGELVLAAGAGYAVETIQEMLTDGADPNEQVSSFDCLVLLYPIFYL